MSQVEIVQGEGNVIIVQGYVDALMDFMEQHVANNRLHFKKISMCLYFLFMFGCLLPFIMSMFFVFRILFSAFLY